MARREPSFKIMDKVKKSYFLRQKISFFLLEKCGRERGGGREKSKTSFDDPWSSFGWNSSS